MLTNADRERLFGKFAYTPAPTSDNPDRVLIEPAWENANIVRVPLTLLSPFARGIKSTWLHKVVVPHFNELLEAWNAKNLLHHVKTFNGGFAPRFRRHITPPILSAHAFGGAFDINAPWNPLGAVPAASGAVGSVWPLVETAEALGWTWGGRWQRPDGMHFEWGKP